MRREDRHQVARGRGARLEPRRPVRGARDSRRRTTAGAASTSPPRRPETLLLADRPRRAITPQRLARRAVRAVRQSLPGLRARLHLLLRAPVPCLLEPRRRASTSRRGSSTSRASPQLLDAELAAPGYVCKPINLGANTDPYQPAEREHRTTRALLEVLLAHRHPVTDRHQGRAGAARPRPARRAGGAAAVLGRREPHHARRWPEAQCSSRVPPRRARGCASSANSSPPAYRSRCCSRR